MKKLIVFIAFCVGSSTLLANNDLITRTGIGSVKTGKVPALQAKMLAKRAAMADAQRQIAEAVNGVQVDSTTTVENYELKSDVVKTSVSGLIRGAFITDEDSATENDTLMYKVTMAVCISGVSPECKGKKTLSETLIEEAPAPKKPLYELKMASNDSSSSKAPAPAHECSGFRFFHLPVARNIGRKGSRCVSIDLVFRFPVRV